MSGCEIRHVSCFLNAVSTQQQHLSPSLIYSNALMYNYSLCIICRLTPKLLINFKWFYLNCMLSKADNSFSVYLNSFCWGLCWFVVTLPLFCCTFRFRIVNRRWAQLSAHHSVCFAEDRKHILSSCLDVSPHSRLIYFETLSIFTLKSRSCAEILPVSFINL